MSDLSRLCEAVIYGNKAEVVNLLQQIPENVNLITPATYDGETFLHLAFENKELREAELIEILELFLDRGIDINLQNAFMKTILHLAIERRLKAVIEMCIRRNADLNVRTKGGSTYAHFVIEEECRKYHSSIRRYDRNNQRLETLEKESSDFVEWIASTKIDFFYKRTVSCKRTALNLAYEFNLQHVLLALLKNADDLSKAKKDYENHFLCAFLKRRNRSDWYFRHNNISPINPHYYENRHVYDIIKMILIRSESISDETLSMAFYIAIDNNEELNVIELLVQRMRDANGQVYGKSLLELFIDKSDTWNRSSNMTDYMKILRTMIIKGADINEKATSFAHILFRNQPKYKILQMLMEIGADFRARGYNGQTFLHLIGQYSNSVEMIDFVTSTSFDLNIKNSKGETPLQVAIFYKHVLVANRLIDKGAKINVSSNDGKSPLSVACETGQAEFAEKLIGSGADLTQRDKKGKTLLHFGVTNWKVAELLIKSRADVNAADDMGKTPLHYAMTDEVVKTLFKAGAHVDVLDQGGCSPFYDSLSRENTMTILQLMKFGADMRDPKVFDYLDKYFKKAGHINNPKLRFLWHLFVKLFAVDFCGEINDFGTNGIEQALQMFFKQCQTELDKLKTFLIDDFTSLYKLLHKNRNRRCAYVDNEKLRTLVKDEELDQKFPNYFDLILGCYNDSVTRKPLLESAVCVLNELVGMLLPDLCTDKIFMYLTNGDLVRFLEVGGDINTNELTKSVIKMYL